MDIVTFLIQIVSGAAGGNIAGSLLRNQSLGALGNTIAGLVGGGIGNAILNNALGPEHLKALANLDPGALISQIAGAGVGGGVLMAIVGVLRQVLAR